MSKTPRALAVTAASVVFLVSACGTNVPHDRVVAVGNGYANPGTRASNTVGGDLTGSPDVPQSSAVTTKIPGLTPGASAPVTTETKGTAPPLPTIGRATGGPGTTGQAPVEASCAGGLKPIVIGQTLAASGLVGAAISGLRTGLAIWAKDVNSRGGVQCHQVKLYQLDDGSDPSRVSSNWNDLVHSKGAVALVGAGVPIAIAALRSAAERDKVAVVGGDVTAEDWNQSPYLFPQGGSPVAGYVGAIIEAAGGNKPPNKVGLLYCVEASVCTTFKNSFPQMASRSNSAAGPVKAVSLTQSDFTSECQAMKDAKVTVLFLGMDGSADARAARSCAALDYHPTMATGSIGVSAQATADSNLQKNHLYLTSGISPFTQSDSAGSRQFAAAFARYAGGAANDQPTMLGWAAGKLFEAALAKESAKPALVTSQVR